MPFNGLTTHDLYQPFMDPTDEKVLQMAIPLFASPQLSIPTPDASTGTSSPPTPELTSAYDDAYSSSFDYGSYAIDETTTTTTTGEDGNTMTPEELLESISTTWPIANPQTTTTTTTAGVCNRCGFQWVEGDKCLICDAADSLASMEDWTLIDNANLTLAAPSAMAAEEIEELASYNHLEDAFNAYVAATSTGQQEGAEEQLQLVQQDEQQQQQQQQMLLVQDNAVDDSSSTEASSSDEDDARSRLSPLAHESYFDGLRIKAPIQNL